MNTLREALQEYLDLRRRAKVSITTVSRVINNIPSVSKKNRAKVEELLANSPFIKDRFSPA